MNILHIANHVKQSGNGIVNVMIDLACEQARLGHNVAVASEGGEYIELLRKNNVQHYKLDQTRKPAQMMQAFFVFRKIVKVFKPDIIHAHMMTGALYSRYLKGFQKYKIVTHVHNEFQKSADYMKVGDSVIAVSQAVAKSMANRGVEEQKLRVVLNGTIGSKRIEDTDGISLKGRSIVTVAGLNERKGISDLIEAFDIVSVECPDSELYIVGDGPDRDVFKLKAAQSFNHQRIHFEGFQADPHKYMSSAEVFVLASHKDPFPLVLVEAREAGCAIIATDVDGIPEALNYGNSGMIVPPRSPDKLAEAIITMLCDEELRDKYKVSAQQGLDFYKVERVAKETIKIYEELRIS
ncbi:glycosyltransferase family 4 protein [Paenibacillus crassostreae]|uniref:Glycosyltransferase n=1 Tax=Paenibacillus crassostreae TaxID=1763538 RepID=A0A167GCM4_9BACL|nr:glycosyltransferase family 4 protein [Paenibacillus crassostreae]AOZ92677.1 glycosyltransferase [Paenibacillus crassostreae]OAB77447.1 glycosyltransferase [Paenibacillus crassostreae]